MKLTKEKLFEIMAEMDFYLEEGTIFIETGTHKGDTCLEMKSIFNEIHTIEIVPELYNHFLEIKPSNVHSHLGDSSKVLQEVYNGHNRTIFWLDGHYVSGIERCSKLDCPLLEELKVIDSKCIEECLILIDDVRLFGTNINEDWSGVSPDSILDTLKDKVIPKHKGRYRFFGDIMAISIKATK